jgi:hypothetical protein
MTFGIERLSNEMAGADLGDARLSWRLGQIVDALAARPGESLPKALQTTAGLEAAYRFMSNKSVIPEAILAPHIAATCERVEAAQVALAIHDTTDCDFRGEARRGLGRLSEQRQGFFAHVCLAVDARGGGPLGILGAHTWTRKAAAPGRKKRSTYEFKTRETKESDRWLEMANEVEELIQHRARIIHVADREADSYRFLASLHQHKAEFVIRASHLERVLADGRSLEQTTDDVKLRLIRQVSLSKHSAKPGLRSSNAERSTRAATLLVGTMAITIKGSWSTPVKDNQEITLHVVRVWEPEPPDGEHPVEWHLLTNLPVTTTAELEFVIDSYRSRWVIEELFKSLKSGCGFEKLQLESVEALLNAFAVMLPVAARLLALRHVARFHPERPASDVLTPLQIRVLRAYKNTARMPLVTARDAMLAVARLGGHIKNNGDPGWIVLGRGYQDLLTLEQGAQLAIEM